jgi:hypothetical protein
MVVYFSLLPGRFGINGLSLAPVLISDLATSFKLYTNFSPKVTPLKI